MKSTNSSLSGRGSTIADTQQVMDLDRAHVWHPYSAFNADLPAYPVVSANGVRIKLADGRELIDGMSSWWCAIHGYNHPVMNQALEDQLKKMAHVMFGGLTHAPAVELAEQLVALTPTPLQSVFFADSGSVSVEVAMKMAIQFWNTKGRPTKQRFLTIRNGYHGDTFGAMSVCDPVNGMHSLFNASLTQQYFVASPTCNVGDPCTDNDIAPLEQQLQDKQEQIAAVILEPIVQGAGGLRFYSADYLCRVRALCDHYDVLLILDEIATGFGRTGRLFACEHAQISPDIMCVGKALTGGYLSLAATLATLEVSTTISNGKPGVFMHGPTFMANPLACAAGLASLELLQTTPWQSAVSQIAQQLEKGLDSCRQYACVTNVRVLGAIGVVELVKPVDMAHIQPMLVEAGVWVRPFGRLLYLMPPYIVQPPDLQQLIAAVTDVVIHLETSLT
ncbi:MAG: adenosylmethionine--8-amino-7-oxononanoate transaminase [Gammaproteobacteria bacterium]|nr:adenosylmethionine--8-amino-7-oxononanoate transaminase [Gammaproteobacteria bacterium]